MKVTDAVCGMTFEEAKAVGTIMYLGEAYYFCSEPCRRQFQAEPERYAGRADREA